MKTLTSLNQQNLADLPASIARPGYDRSDLKAGIVHIGVGGFHRSHEAYYTDALLEKTGTTDWGICGVGLRPADRKIAEVLAEAGLPLHPDRQTPRRSHRKPRHRFVDRFHARLR